MKKFNWAQKNLGMSWKDTTQYFLNCYGETSSLWLDSADKTGFKQLVTGYIKKLCKDDDAKGTLKVAVFKDYWQKPADVEINDHNLCIQHLLQWMDMIPGYNKANLSVKEQNCIPASSEVTFPWFWSPIYIYFLHQKGVLLLVTRHRELD